MIGGDCISCREAKIIDQLDKYEGHFPEGRKQRYRKIVGDVKRIWEAKM